MNTTASASIFGLNMDELFKSGAGKSFDDLLKSDGTKTFIDELLGKDPGTKTFVKNIADLLQPQSQKQELYADIFENNFIYWILIDIPGCVKQNIKCDIINDKILQINCVKKQSATFDDYTTISNERLIGKLTRNFELPENIDQSTIKAVYENGVLTVWFHKIVEKINKKSVEIN
jgi:HSP20 family protein